MQKEDLSARCNACLAMTAWVDPVLLRSCRSSEIFYIPAGSIFEPDESKSHNQSQWREGRKEDLLDAGRLRKFWRLRMISSRPMSLPKHERPALLDPDLLFDWSSRCWLVLSINQDRSHGSTLYHLTHAEIFSCDLKKLLRDSGTHLDRSC